MAGPFNDRCQACDSQAHCLGICADLVHGAGRRSMGHPLLHGVALHAGGPAHGPMWARPLPRHHHGGRHGQPTHAGIGHLRA